MEQPKSAIAGAFDTMKAGVSRAKSAITDPATQEKLTKGANSVLAGLVGLINKVTYTATAAVVAAKNGIVDGVSDTDKNR